jgi:SAM-dependent methyltransferase
VLTHLDVPQDGIIRGPFSQIHGWIASETPSAIERLTLVNGAGTEIPLSAVDRPDVRTALPEVATSGFTCWIDLRDAASGPWRVRYQAGGATAEADLALHADDERARAFSAAKTRKLAMVRPLLRCPFCRGELADDAGTLKCAAGHRFSAGPDSFDFLTDDVRERIGATPTDNVSAHGYDETLRALIAASEGPILDIGAGLRPEYRDDVVNLEIVPYPTTDVIAAGEYLPFADAAFDLLISVAMLEHVRDPFATAREQARVLRPGGRIFAAVPFLQPYHGYPHHYYNMTADGLRNLFPDFEVERLDVPASGDPIFALTWILRSWLAGLPAAAAAAFADTKVRDLAVDPLTLFDRPFVTELDPATRVELAALNVLVARKPG